MKLTASGLQHLGLTMLLPTLLLAAGCAGRVPLSARSKSFSACPGPLSIDVLLGGPVKLGTRAYRIRADEQHYTIAGRRSIPLQTVSTTLSTPTLVVGDWHEGAGVLHILGCRGEAQVLVTFGDSDADGAIDDYLGEYTLPSDWHVTSGVAALATGHVYLFDAKARAVIRLTDSNADQVPDGHATFATHDEETSYIVAHVVRMTKAPGGTLTLGPGRLTSNTSKVTVIVDADGDGTPESVKTMLYATARAAPPLLLEAPQVGDLQGTASGIPGTTLQLWKVDSEGRRLGQDPLGSVTLGSEDATGVITWTPGLEAGQFVRVSEARPNTLPGPIQEVEPNYPRVSELSRPSIDGSTTHVITVTGTGFNAGTRVKLIQDTPALELTLTPTLQSATRLQVTIPALPTPWIGSVRLRAYNASTPVTERGGHLVVYR